MRLSRRLALAGMTAAAAFPVSAQQPRPREEEPLILRAHRKGLTYGTAIGLDELNNSVVADILADECGLLMPGPETSWSSLQPQPGRFEFAATDRLISFAQRRNLLLRMRGLVQHDPLPDWMAEAITPATAGRTLSEHVGPVIARYRGRVHSWDVVGGAVEPAHGRSDGLRVSPWLKSMGPRYVDVAFRLARAIDRDALLAYSESDLDAATAEHAARRRAVLDLLEWLKSRGAPVDALAIRSTLSGPFDPAQWQAFLREIAGLGLRIIVTDLAVAEPRDGAERIGRYIEATLEQRVTIAVLSAGLSMFGKRPPQGQPLDADLNRTQVWAALARAFDAAPAR